MGHKSGRRFTGGQGSIRARARERLTGPPADLVQQTEQKLGGSGGEEHYVRLLAQERTVEMIAVLSHIARRGKSESARARSAIAVLEIGWGKPGPMTPKGKGLIGNDGGRGLNITIKSAVTPGVHTTVHIGAGEEQPDAIDVTPAPELPAPLDP